ncbi:hypothetical protein EAH81_13240 [Flavobacterium pectinovorum]|uniref:Uncharacterized protein n=2 Tax=Flavobacterium pectinovorum TaxID=29533 RepID=A0A502EVV3_9FLAO|nr:hypothetical protein EAH81_13240 [Flavobacterium pectinovorum]
MVLKRMTIGNIFKINIEKEVRYFQYFYSDSNYLGGDLIWIFNLNEDTENLNEILNSGYSFYFYTTVETGVKLKKWKLLGNLEIPEEMKSHLPFRWRDIETGIWYKLQYDKKTPLGTTLTNEQLKIPIVSFQFPV